MAADEFVDRCRLFHGIARHAVLRSPCRRTHAKQDRTERRRVQHSAFARRYAVSLAGRFGPVFVCCFYWRSAPTPRRLVAVTTMVSVGKIVQFCAGRLVEPTCSLDPIWTLRPRPLRAARGRSYAADQLFTTPRTASSRLKIASGSSSRKGVEVQVLSSAPNKSIT